MQANRNEQRSFGNKESEQIGQVFWLSTPEQGDIALTHLPTNADNPKKQATPIIFLPGMFSNRRFWLSDKRIGLAAYLSDLGYDCWMIDRRGLGESGKAGYKNISLMQCIEHDLPAVQAFVHAHNPQAAYWVGHSFGGVLNALSLAQGRLKSEYVAGLINFSSQLTVGKKLLNKPFSALIYASTAVFGHFPARKLKMGPDNEAPEAMRDCCRLVDWAKKERSSSHADSFWQGFDTITQPILAFGSEGDTVDPAAGCRELIAPIGSENKDFILLGKQHGHRQDYGHVAMLVSKDAAQEVWPMVRQWLEKHAK